MFIVNRSIFLTLLLLLVSCAEISQTSESSNCLERRGAIDLGSGSTKLVIGLVNTCEQRVENIIFEAQRAVALKEELQRSKSNKFSRETINKLINVFNEFKMLSKREGATQIRAVATSAFRTASNTSAVVKEVKDAVDIQITVIEQDQEATFSYYAALSAVKNSKIDSKRPVAVWDIGGGSMQITKPTKKGPKSELLKVASVTFKNKVVNGVYGDKRKSPNPLGEKNAIRAMDMARVIGKDSADSFGTLADYEVIGVGGVHYFSVGSLFKNHEYGQDGLLKKLIEKSKLSDKQLGGKYAATDVTNIALVLGFMQSYKIDKMRALKINMAHGLLINESFWD